jgi:hypothetical protein
VISRNPADAGVSYFIRIGCQVENYIKEPCNCITISPTGAANFGLLK